MKADVLIIGQGLAGSMLAHFLMQQGRQVVVADAGNSASEVAAGLFNPVTGRRFAKSWMIDALLPFAETTYKALEEQLQATFFHHVPMLRVFPSADERERILAKFRGWEGAAYIGEIFDPMQLPGYAPFSAGGCFIKGTGYLDTSGFISSYGQYLQSKGLLIAERFEEKDAEITTESIKWNGVEAEKMIFCQGYTGAQSTWFGALPFSLVKGEVISFYAPGLDGRYIVNKAGYIIPLGGGHFRMGATYNWDDLAPTPTAAGLAELEDKLQKLIQLPYELTGHRAGVRPAVKQRRPMAGMHPTQKNIGIFNGLGTKGVLLAPYFARQLAAHIAEAEPLQPEIDINLL